MALLHSPRRRRIAVKNSARISNSTRNESYALCYYIYKIFMNMQNQKVTTDYDETVTAFFEYCSKLDLTERLTSVLSEEVKTLEAQNCFTRIHKPCTKKSRSSSREYEVDSEEEITFDNDEPYVYVEDKYVDRLLRRFDTIDSNTINLARILLARKKEPVFSEIINTVIFRNDESCKLCKDFKPSKAIKKAIFDYSKTEFLVNQIGFSKAEAQFILYEYRINNYRFLRYLRDDDDLDLNSTGFISELMETNEKEIRDILRSDQKVKSFGFIDEDGDYNHSIDECIESQSIDPYFSDLIKPADCSDAYDLDSFSIRQESIEICLDLLKGKNPASLLFYGKPGSGKTELAKALCKQTGKKVFIFKNESESEGYRNLLGHVACYLSLGRKDSILIVDEADTVLKTIDFSLFSSAPAKTKGIVNKMLENNMNKVIYIINHKNLIDTSTLRRFNFSIQFEAMSASTLRSIAQSKLAPVEIEDDTKTELLNMLEKYHLTGSSVDNLVKVIEGMECKGGETLLKKTEIVMKENSRLLFGKAKMRENVKAEYDPKVLNASTDPLEIVEMVQNAIKFSEKNKGTENGIRMLFYGLSGTGKTELARYISEKLGKPIVLKRASDIFDKYVGENEKNICRAFDEAENSGAILLFDEADSFFYDRNKAQRSWELSTVNEFLTQMEEFSGILICTTNLRKIMDPAMQRRFHIMVEFKPMKFDGIKTMAERYFPSFHLSNSQIEELEDSESVTPGDFGSLASRIRFMNPDKVDSAFIMEELKKIQIEKKNQWDKENGGTGNKIGF